eukprot:XP_011678954.1 PREDICTED: myosin heavy chain, striated muscle [Strongylocentrotus purpuratus]
MFREQSSKQLSLKTMELATVVGQYEALKREAEKERHQSHQKIDDLTAELDADRNNMQAAREEISKQQLQLADANLTLQSNKENYAALNTPARKKKNPIFDVQCEEQKKAVDKTSQLLADLESRRSENSRLSLELMKKTSEWEQANQSRDRLATVLEETSAKLEELQSTHEDLTKQLVEKSKMIDILTQERDHYQQMSMERIKELGSATSLQNRLQSQVTEREHEYQMMYQEKVNLTQVIESSERKSLDTRQEKDNLIKLLDEKTKQCEEVKGLKDDLNRKLKVREKRIQSLDLEVKTLSEAVKEKHSEVEKVIEGKAGLLEGFKTFQQKVTHLTSEKDVLETRYLDLEASQEKTRSRLQLRIQGLEHDLRMTLEALRATKSTDARAVDIADSVQQELLTKRHQVDFLQIRIHGLEESLGAAIKEKSLLETEKALLEEQVSKLKEQMERFQRKLKSLSDKRTSQKDIVTRLETALEKAALKHTDAQRLIEEQEQAIAKMTLRHQLELKALQRTLATSRASSSRTTPNQSSMSTQQRMTTRGSSSKTTPNQSSMSTQQRMTTVEKVQTSESATTLTKIQQSLGKASTGVVASHFLQSASVQAMEGLVGRNYISPIPVVVMNTSGIQGDHQPDRHETSGAVEEAHNVSSELKDLLEEVKSVFSANMAALKDTQSGHKEASIHTGIDRLGLKEKSTFNSVNGHGVYQLVEPAKDSHSVPPPNTEDMLDPPLLTSSPYKLDSENTPPPPAYQHLHLKGDQELQTPSSPVTNLLGLHGKVQSDTALLKLQGHRAKQTDRETSLGPAVNRAQRHGTTGAAVITHSVNDTTERSMRSTVTKSYSVNRPAKHSSNTANVRDSVHTTKREAMGTVRPGVHGASEHHGSRETAFTRKVKHSHATTGSTTASDISVPLRIEVPEPGYAHTREARLDKDLETLNQRNRIESGYGDVEMINELIITDDDDDDNSSITTVTSYSTDVTSNDQPDRSDSLKSLKERLAALSQMGNQLQKGNKEMAGLIRRQDDKLKRCRQEERNAKRIINSK